jgi:hypothetical protein
MLLVLGEVDLLALGRNIEQEDRDIHATVKVITLYPPLLSLPLPTKRILRAPPVPGISSPASGVCAKKVFIGSHSSSVTPALLALLIKTAVSTTICISIAGVRD